MRTGSHRLAIAGTLIYIIVLLGAASIASTRLHEWARDRRTEFKDGVRVSEEDGWIWFGPDPFNAQFLVVAEGRSQDFVDQHLLGATAMITEWQKD